MFVDDFAEGKITTRSGDFSLSRASANRCLPRRLRLFTITQSPSLTRRRIAMRSFVVLVTVVSAGIALAQEKADQELARFDGEWEMQSGTVDGIVVDQETLKFSKGTTKGGVTKILFFDQVYLEAKFTIDPSKKPRTIDFTITGEVNKGKVQLGIYEFEGDTVKICFAAIGQSRPTDFTAKKGSERTLCVWKREKK
jgi:uncharacterized protein (TIGR03067 family)